MKKGLVFASTFVFYFIVNVAIRFLFGDDTNLTAILISVLISDIIFHISFCFVMHRIGKKMQENTDE